MHFPIKKFFVRLSLTKPGKIKKFSSFQSHFVKLSVTENEFSHSLEIRKPINFFKFLDCRFHGNDNLSRLFIQILMGLKDQSVRQRIYYEHIIRDETSFESYMELYS